MDLQELIDALRRPAAYPHPVDEVAVVQTHISVVFLAGEHVYKLKKPVDLGFLDYGTLEKRRHFCEEEVRLNRRLAPDVYRGVVEVVQGDGGPRFAQESGAEGAVEPAVWMRRLPDDHTALERLQRGELTDAQVGAIGRRIAEFHAGAESGDAIARYARFDAVAGNARDNFRQSTDQIGVTVRSEVYDRLVQLNEAALERHRDLIERRATHGVPCDTHGDLRLDHVYLFPENRPPDDLVVVDCIEFNPAFRYADPVADIAFLVMDLCMSARPDLATTLADAYFEASGDDEGRALLDFYVAYRAAVRGKVQGIKALEREVSEAERRDAARTAGAHWLLALASLAPPPERPCLVLVGGLPGTGKSTLARHVAESGGFEWIRTDAVRKELAGLSEHDDAGAAYGAGIYTPDWSKKTYEACLQRTEDMLWSGKRVVVDASFHDEARRRQFLDAARSLGVTALLLVCEVPEATVRERLRQRTGDVSDADWEIYRGMAERWQAPDVHTRRVTHAVGTEAGEEASAHAALEVLRSQALA